LFAHPSDVIAALRRFRTYYDPKTASILLVGRGGEGAHGDPFRGGFLNSIEERHELLRRLGTLEPRSRKLLILWFVEGVPVAHIARKLSMSRVHCYRVQRAALDAMLDHDTSEEPSVAEAQ
jgi:DNA-directed RNA polymerase specialized sigma24 family protein